MDKNSGLPVAEKVLFMAHATALRPKVVRSDVDCWRTGDLTAPSLSKGRSMIRH